MKKTILKTILIVSLFFTFKTYGQVVNYADSIIAFSSEYSVTGWSADRALNIQDVYPSYGDLSNAWASSTSGNREFLELYFDNAIPIDSIFIYETYHGGAVDTVYIKNPNSGLWEIVYQGPASDILTSRIFKIGFPITNFPVSEIRIAIDGAESGSYAEIDAVALVSNTPTGLTENMLLESVFLYPNPNEGKVNLDLTGLTDVTIKVFDVSGQLIYSKMNINDTYHQFELNISSGVYFVQVISQEERKKFKLLKK